MPAPCEKTTQNTTMTSAHIAELKRQLDQSEAMHHKIMAKMADERFDLLETWERKERLDLEIGKFIRAALQRSEASTGLQDI